jgi:hypothetical protein
MTLEQALEATIDARHVGGPEYAALTEHMRALARVLDERPTNSVALRAWAPAMRLLLTLGDDLPDEAAAEFLRVVSTPTGGKSR